MSLETAHKRADAADKRSRRRKAVWHPIFADVLIGGEKVGHIASDGYSQTHWNFYPTDPKRKERRRHVLAEAVPKWVERRGYAFGLFRTMGEVTNGTRP